MSDKKRTIVLIHGLWMTALCWEHWIEFYMGRSYRVIAESWPGMGGDIEQLRRDPAPIANLGINEIVDRYQGIVEALDDPPIIIGHSFGGLVTEILLDRGLGSAGVAIAPAPVKGIVFLPLSTLRVTFPALSNPANSHRALPLTPEQFHYAFTNTLSDEASLAVYNRYAVPGPDHVLFQAALANFNPHAPTTVDFQNGTRAPLLLMAGGNDHVSPVAVVKANYRLFSNSGATTDYKEYPERTHYTLGEAGWEQVAGDALAWAEENAREQPVR